MPRRRDEDVYRAPAPPLHIWNKWLGYLFATGCPKVFLAAWFTSSIGLRATEALSLRRSDLQMMLDGRAVQRVTIRTKEQGGVAGAVKSPGEVVLRTREQGELALMLKHRIPHLRPGRLWHSCLPGD